MATHTDFNPEYVKGFKSASEFINHYRGLHKFPATTGQGKDEKPHPLAGQINKKAASNQISDAEMIEVYKSVHEPEESEIDHTASSGGDEE
jgi:hypothetical protein